jgi:hypothetical protein
MRDIKICTLHKIQKMRRVGHGACMGDMKNAYNVLVWKPERSVNV